MKIKPYIEKLNNSDVYKSFTKKYKDSFLVAGFFILDLEMGKNMHQIDYYVPSEKKIAAFSLDGGVNMQLLEGMNAKVPEKLDINTNIDLEAIPGILEDEMKNRSITEEIKKIIAIIQNIDGKKVWNLSCVLSGMEILRAHIEDESKTVLKMERSSMMDIVKKISGPELEKLREANAANKAKPKDQLENLNKLEKEIEKEKQEIQKQMNKDSSQPQKAAKSKKKSA